MVVAPQPRIHHQKQLCVAILLSTLLFLLSTSIVQAFLVVPPPLRLSSSGMSVYLGLRMNERGRNAAAARLLLPSDAPDTMSE